MKILAEAGATVVVDSIAGTSAGGLNGTLLASAVATGKDLPPMGARWSDLASLGPRKLLPAADKTVKSLLDGNFFEQQIGHLLAEIAEKPPITEPTDCTLLVTATAIDAKPVPVTLEGVAVPPSPTADACSGSSVGPTTSGR